MLRLGQFLQPLLGPMLGLGQLLYRSFQSLQPRLGPVLRLGEGDEGGSQLVLSLLQGTPYMVAPRFQHRDQPLDQFSGNLFT